MRKKSEKIQKPRLEKDAMSEKPYMVSFAGEIHQINVFGTSRGSLADQADGFVL